MSQLLNSRNATVIVEKSPAGGIPDTSALCYMENNAIKVFLYEGPLRYMHAKYAVSGNLSLILSENFEGFRSRGWGVIVEDEQIARNLSLVFENDLKDSVPFRCEMEYRFKEAAATGKELPSYEGNVSLIIAPGATEGILKLLDSARERLWIEQFYIHRKWSEEKNPFLETVIRKGVPDKRVILDGTWYNVDKEDSDSNYNTDLYLSGKGIPSKIVSSVQVHNKGVIADDAAFVSSINWNENSPRRNREVGIIITGGAADYFATKFEQDWNGSFPVVYAILAAFLFAYVIVTIIKVSYKVNVTY